QRRTIDASQLEAQASAEQLPDQERLANTTAPVDRYQLGLGGGHRLLEDIPLAQASHKPWLHKWPYPTDDRTIWLHMRISGQNRAGTAFFGRKSSSRSGTARSIIARAAPHSRHRVVAGQRRGNRAARWIGTVSAPQRRRATPAPPAAREPESAGAPTR